MFGIHPATQKIKRIQMRGAGTVVADKIQSFVCVFVDRFQFFMQVFLLGTYCRNRTVDFDVIQFTVIDQPVAEFGFYLFEKSDFLPFTPELIGKNKLFQFVESIRQYMRGIQRFFQDIVVR